MALDDLDDPQASALAALLGPGINAELAEASGEPPIVGLYTCPLTLEQIPSGRFPALIVWRAEARDLPRTLKQTDIAATFRFHYFSAPTPLDKVEKRWASLHSVWTALRAIATVGNHPAVAGGASILRLAGFSGFDERTPRVRYLAPTVGETVIHRFEGEIVLFHRDRIDTSGLAPYLELFAAITRVDALPATQPQVELLTRTVDGEIAHAADGDDFDPDAPEV